MPTKPLYIIHTTSLYILDQLWLEEYLLKHSDENYCLINEGTSPAIVMGISGKAEELIDLSIVKSKTIPIIQRFSGGGTVVVDRNTLFVTYIFQKDAHPFLAYPEPILNWSAHLYQQAFPDIYLKENDYVIQNRKCGGNAQYLRKNRWLHHTSFLWDYSSEYMNYLLHPKKTPTYRAARAHENFICKLSDHYPDKRQWISNLKQVLEKRYLCHAIDMQQFESAMESSSDRSSKLVEIKHL
jgi:lipoate-protein ligase A